MRVDASKLLIIFVQLLFSRMLLNFSVDHLWLLSPGCCLQITNRNSGQREENFRLYIKSSSPPAMISAQFPIVVVCRDWYTQQDSLRFYVKRWNVRKHSSLVTWKGIKCPEYMVFLVDKFSASRLHDNGVFVFVNILCDWGERCSVRRKRFVHLIGSYLCMQQLEDVDDDGVGCYWKLLFV